VTEPRTPGSSDRYRRVWFPRTAKRIVIIAPVADDDLPDSRLTSPNYSLFDRLGDRDSVYALGHRLGQRYPSADVQVMPADETAVIPLKENLVVVGGPGEYDSEARSWLFGNSVCRAFQERIPSNFSYGAEAETLRAAGREFVAAVDGEGRTSADWGIFRRFPNPFNRRAVVVMVHGIHTLGVLGAVRAFEGTDESEDNFDVLERTLGSGSSAFECFFRTDVLNGQVAVPRVRPGDVFSLVGESQRSLTADRHDPPEIVDLRREIGDYIQAAWNQAPALRRPDLARLRDECQTAQPDYAQCQRILEICRSSDLLPADAVEEIRGVLSP
jgi:hypothetical protein